ncbi:response regulator [Nostoc cycadae]|uniref:Two-component response regulator n=1 Tax=Nostoc cycadae WK-1 TaxID=1861711 RepID=A0A2H6LLK2_9NOSO|nr:response regulator [Nostoc cycadae]GBE94091.1 two-component response regulator [Nostoc cycadae WK-1]
MNKTNKYILICDDCPITCLLLKTILETNGYKVETVFSGTEVLAKIETQVFDLLVLDVTMPGMDGYEVAHHIQQNRSLKCLPILLLSGHEEDEIRKKCQARVAGIIRKPVDMNSLIEIVKKALELNDFEQASLV